LSARPGPTGPADGNGSVRAERLTNASGLETDGGKWKMMRGLLLLIAGLLAAPPALAVEALSTEELMSHCDRYHDESAREDRIFCVRYIQGFIDGAVATDGRVTRNVVKEYDREETYSERAARTRIGKRLERFGASVYAEFCLGDPVPLREVVEHVVEDATDAERVAANPLARELVYQTLREHYPCPTSD
jgi:hypothetical protein